MTMGQGTFLFPGPVQIQLLLQMRRHFYKNIDLPTLLHISPIESVMAKACVMSKPRNDEQSIILPLCFAFRVINESGMWPLITARIDTCLDLSAFVTHFLELDTAPRGHPINLLIPKTVHVDTPALASVDHLAFIFFGWRFLS